MKKRNGTKLLGIVLAAALAVGSGTAVYASEPEQAEGPAAAEKSADKDTGIETIIIDFIIFLILSFLYILEEFTSLHNSLLFLIKNLYKYIKVNSVAIVVARAAAPDISIVL